MPFKSKTQQKAVCAKAADGEKEKKSAKEIGETMSNFSGLGAGLGTIGGAAVGYAKKRRNLTGPAFTGSLIGAGAGLITGMLVEAYDSVRPEKAAALELDIDIGDTILTGRFKNSPKVVKSFGTDEKGQPTINGMKALAFRIKKLMPGKQAKKEKKVMDKQAGLREILSTLKGTKFRTALKARKGLKATALKSKSKLDKAEKAYKSQAPAFVKRRDGMNKRVEFPAAAKRKQQHAGEALGRADAKLDTWRRSASKSGLGAQKNDAELVGGLGDTARAYTTIGASAGGGYVGSQLISGGGAPAAKHASTSVIGLLKEARGKSAKALGRPRRKTTKKAALRRKARANVVSKLLAVVGK